MQTGKDEKIQNNYQAGMKTVDGDSKFRELLEHP
jgi:hypothetical protein